MPPMRVRRPQRAGHDNAYFAGEAGEFAAQQRPDMFFNNAARDAGFMGAPGTAQQEWLSRYALPGFVSGYEGALGRNERLKLQDYMARFGGDMSGQLGRAFNEFQAASDPRMRANVYLRDAGMVTGTGSDYEDYLQDGYSNDLMASLYQAQRADPSLGVDEYFSGTRSPRNALFTGDLDGDGMADDTSDLNDPLRKHKRKRR